MTLGKMVSLSKAVSSFVKGDRVNEKLYEVSTHPHHCVFFDLRGAVLLVSSKFYGCTLFVPGCKNRHGALVAFFPLLF